MDGTGFSKIDNRFSKLKKNPTLLIDDAEGKRLKNVNFKYRVSQKDARFSKINNKSDLLSDVKEGITM